VLFIVLFVPRLLRWVKLRPEAVAVLRNPIISHLETTTPESG